MSNGGLVLCVREKIDEVAQKISVFLFFFFLFIF